MAELMEVVADPSRREILRLVWDRELPVGDLVASLSLKQPTVSHHLRVLRETDLVDVRTEGNKRLYRARPEALGALKDYLESYWRSEAMSLKALIESKKSDH